MKTVPHVVAHSNIASKFKANLKQVAKDFLPIPKAMVSSVKVARSFGGDFGKLFMNFKTRTGPKVLPCDVLDLTVSKG